MNYKLLAASAFAISLGISLAIITASQEVANKELITKDVAAVSFDPSYFNNQIDKIRTANTDIAMAHKNHLSPHKLRELEIKKTKLVEAYNKKSKGFDSKAFDCAALPARMD